jgi:O-antigen/teichoic acid export membrane protein
MSVATPAPADREGSLTSRAFWILSAKMLSLALGVAVPLILVRSMSQEEFGLYKQIFLVIGTAYTVLPLGFAMSVFYFFPRESERRGAVVWHVLLYHSLTGLAAAAVLALWPEVLEKLFRDPELVTYGPAMGLVVFLWCASLFIEFVAIANGETRLAAVFIGAIHSVKAVLLLAAALIWGSLDAIVGSAVALGVIQMGLVLFYLGSRFPGYFREFDSRLMKEQLAYAMPYGAAALLWVMRSDFHRYYVAYQFDAAVFALYAVGCFEVPVFGVLRESVSAVMIPRVNELSKQGRPREILLLAARAMRKLCAFEFPVAAFLVLNAREIVHFLFTERYTESAPLFAVNALVIPLVAVALVADAVTRAHSEHRFFVVKANLALTVAQVLGLVLVVGRFGLLGAVLVVIGTEALGYLILGIKTWRILGASRGDLSLFSDLVKIVLATVLATASAALVREALLPAAPLVVLIGAGAVFGLVYFTALFLLKVPNSAELDALRVTLDRFRRPARATPGPLSQVRAE